MAVTEGSRIKNPYYAKQLIDFQGLGLDGGLYPTDIDALIEYHDMEYILVEVKYKNKRVPYSQKLAIQRMIEDFTKAGKRAIALIAEHYESDPRKPVIAASCKVRELYYGKECQWRAPTYDITVRQAVDSFRNSTATSIPFEGAELI